MFVNNLENNAEKKTTLYLRFEKYHNLHFFNRRKSWDWLCINKTFIAPAVLMNRSNTITNYELGNFDLYMVKNLSTRQQSVGLSSPTKCWNQRNTNSFLILLRFSAMQFSIIRLGIVNVETKGLKWLEEKIWFFKNISVYLACHFEFWFKVLMSVFLKSVSTSRLKGLHKNSKMRILIVIILRSRRYLSLPRVRWT